MARVSASDFRRGRKGHAVMLNVRLVPKNRRTTTEEEATAALQHYVDTGSVPDGWTMRGIEWSTGANRRNKDFLRGHLEDLDTFHAVLATELADGRVRFKAEPRHYTVRQTEYRYRSTKTGRFTKALDPNAYPVEYSFEYDVEYYEWEAGVDYDPR